MEIVECRIMITTMNQSMFMKGNHNSTFYNLLFN